MIRKLNTLLLTNAPLKIISLIFGYIFWYIFSSTHMMSVWLTIPVCFDAIPEKMHIAGPEYITIQITGKREYIRSSNIVHNLAAHIDAQKLSVGSQKITITEDMLLLPDTIKLVHCYPINIEVLPELSGEHIRDIAQGQTA